MTENDDTVPSSPAGTDAPDRPMAPFAAWERRTRVWALVFAAVTLLVTVALAAAIRPGWAMFFAVTSEYFFQRPGIMQQKHPLLYAALERVFNQDLRSRVAAVQQQLARGRPTFGRNSPCPCGSGRKFKKCCLA